VKETKEEKFIRVGDPRVNNLILQIHKLGNLSRAAVYAYTEEQIESMFGALHNALDEVKAQFLNPGQTAPKRFTF
jgi:hypothetical protein